MTLVLWWNSVRYVDGVYQEFVIFCRPSGVLLWEIKWNVNFASLDWFIVCQNLDGQSLILMKACLMMASDVCMHKPAQQVLPLSQTLLRTGYPLPHISIFCFVLHHPNSLPVNSTHHRMESFSAQIMEGSSSSVAPVNWTTKRCNLGHHSRKKFQAPGDPVHLQTKVMGAGASATQNFDPLKKICRHICGFRKCKTYIYWKPKCSSFTSNAVDMYCHDMSRQVWHDQTWFGRDLNSNS